MCNVGIRTSCSAILLKNTTSVLQGMAYCRNGIHTGGYIELIYFVGNPRRIYHVSVTFFILQRTVKYPNEQDPQTLHLLHKKEKKPNQILTYVVDITLVIITGNSKGADIQGAQYI